MSRSKATVLIVGLDAIDLHKLVKLLLGIVQIVATDAGDIRIS